MLLCLSALAQSQTAGDYRSAATGNWNDIATWETYNGSAWVAASATPTSTDGAITIRSPHTVTITASGLTYDQVVVDAGGQVTVNSAITSTLANGTGTDLTINGTWLNSGGTWTVTGTAWTVGSGGTYIHNTTSSAATPLGQATFDAASTMIFRGSSTINTAVSLAGRTFGNLTIESSSGTWTPATFAGGTAMTVNGNYLLGANVNATTTQTGVMTFAGNFTVNGTLTNSTGTQTYTFTGGSKTISGTGTFQFETFNVNSGASLTASVATSIPATFTATISGSYATAATYTNNGTTNVNGTFQINQGGFASANDLVYASGATLVFNNTSGSYGINSGSTAFWPSTNGPQNVNVLGAGGITLNVSRTATGTVQTSAGFINGNNLTASGTVQINSGGFFTGSPVYSGTPTLVYNTGGTYGVGAEWEAGTTVGSGVPHHVTTGNSTTVNMPNSDRTVPGNLTIGIGALVLNASSGDLKIGGNWARSVSGTFTPNNRAVWFNGTGTQTIAATSGAETFNYLIVDKSAGDLTLSSPALTSVTVNATSGDALQILNSGGIDLNGQTLTMSGIGGNFKVSGGARSVTGTGTFAVLGSKTVASASGGTLSFGSNVTVVASAGFDFGSGLSTVNGTCQLNSGGFVNTNPPVYGSSSTLKYNSGGTYGRGAEWSATSGAGYPAHVQISNSTILDLGNGGAGTARQISGSLTIDIGSTLSMAVNPMTASLTVSGNAAINGTLALSSSSGGDFNLGGDWSHTGTFTPNNRVVTFNGTGAQGLTGATTFDYLTINKSSGTLSLSQDVNVNQSLTLSGGVVATGSNRISLASGATATRTAGHVNGNVEKNYATGSQSFTYHIGDASEYAPVDLANFGVTTAGAVTATTAAGDHPNLGTSSIDNAKSANRYWTLTPDGSLAFSSYDATMHFVAGDLDGGANTSNFHVEKYNGSWSTLTTGTQGLTSTQATGITSFSDFAVGESSVGPLDHFLVEAFGGGAIPSQTAGTPFSIQVTAKDASNNTVTSFTGTVDVTSSGTLSAGGGTTAAFTAGVLSTHSVTITNTGSFSITATTTGGSETGASNLFTVGHGTLDHFLVEAAGGGAIPTQSAGTPFAIQVMGQDAFNNTATSFAGTVDITSSGTLMSGGGTTISFSGGVLSSHNVAISSVGTFDITATLTGGSENGTSNTFLVNVGPLDNFLVEAAGGGAIPPQTAGTPFSVQVTARDIAGNTVTSFTSTVDISSSGTLSAGSGTTAAFAAGVLSSHSVTISNTGSFSITATRTGGSETGSSNLFTVDPGPLFAFIVEAAGGGSIPTQTAGISFSIQITAVDALNNTVTGFTSTVDITSAATISSGGGTTAAFTAGVLASHGVTITNTGTFDLVATRTGGSEMGTSNLFSVDPGALDHFLVESAGGGAIPAQTAGIAFNIQMTAQDAFNNTVIGFVSTVDITSAGTISSGGGTTGAFTAGVLSLHSVTLTSAGTFDITATRTGGSEAGTSNSFLVNHAVIDHYLVEAAGGGAIPTQSAGVAFNIQVTAQDAFNNTVTTFAGTVDVTSTGTLSSGGGTTIAFTAGVLTPHSVTVTSSGSIDITATTTGGSETGTSNLFVVTPAGLDHYVVEASGGGAIPTQTAGAAFSIQVTAADAFNNTVTGFTGTVDITSSGTLSSGGGTTLNFTAGVLSSHNVTISNTGSFSITATTTGGSETGTSNLFTVNAGTLDHFLVEASGGGAIPTQTAQVTFAIQVTAQDAFNNTVTSFVGTTDIMSTGTLTLGSGTTSAFVLGVLSSHSVRISTAGLQSVTATLTGGSENGTSNTFTVDPGPLANFLVEASGGGAIGSQYVAVPFAIRVTARDASGNTVTTFAGTVDISSTGTLSAGSGTTISFSAGVLASHSVTFGAPGTVFITATRTGGSETGSSNAFSVNQTYYTITATAGPDGAIDPAGIITVAHGSNKTFLMNPNPGYQVEDVLVDAGSVGDVTSYTFTSITANHTIDVSFEPNTIFLTLPPESLITKDPVRGRLLKPVRRGRNLMPNWANLMQESVLQGAFQPLSSESDNGGGMRVGISFMAQIAPNVWRPIRDYAAVYPWVRLTKWNFVRNIGLSWNYLQKTLEDRTGKHIGDAGGLDSSNVAGDPRRRPLHGQYTKLPPKKHSNELFAELVALKFNIGTSQLNKTPLGFGELIFDRDGNLYDELTIVEIAAKADTAMTFWVGRDETEYDDLYDAINDINRAFAGPLDTLRFNAGGQLFLNGQVDISTIDFLRPAVVPPLVLTPTTLNADEIEEEDFEDAEFDGEIPVAVKLYQNYPNPFNPMTTIGFRLKEPGLVSIGVFDMLGREVGTLAHQEEMDEGYNTVDFFASNLASGVYFYRVMIEDLEYGDVVDIKTNKMVLLK